MDLLKLISDIEKVDPEVYERLDPRRRVFKHFGLAGKALTAAMLPGLVGGIFQRAYGQGNTITPAVRDVLNLALSLEYLEFYFYDTAIKTSGLIPSTDLPAFQIIRNDESGHIKVLREALGTAAVNPAREDFDYTGGRGLLPGPFATVFSDYKIFLGVAQSFVDTGVRAYKGGAPVLMVNPDILESALNIHSVEARHSSHVRTVRRGVAANATATTVPGDLNNLSNQPKSWISGNDNGGPSPANTAPVYGAGNPATGNPDASYPSENNTSQAGVPIANAASGINAAAASEAFDEPLDPATVKSIARNFVKATSTLFV